MKKQNENSAYVSLFPHPKAIGTNYKFSRTGAISLLFRSQELINYSKSFR